MLEMKKAKGGGLYTGTVEGIISLLFFEGFGRQTEAWISEVFTRCCH